MSSTSPSGAAKTLGIYGPKPYESDGGFSALGLFLTTGVGVAVAVATGVAAAFIGRFFYAVLIFPLFIGAAVGAAQAWAVRHTKIRTPIVCVVIGEGGSGGALGIGVGDRVAVLEYAYYSVISPEGCAGILWKSHDYAPQAARALKITSRHLHGLGVIDDVVEEPLGGAHRDHYQMASRLKMYLGKTLRELHRVPVDELLQQRE